MSQSKSERTKGRLNDALGVIYSWTDASGDNVERGVRVPAYEVLLVGQTVLVETVAFEIVCDRLVLVVRVPVELWRRPLVLPLFPLVQLGVEPLALDRLFIRIGSCASTRIDGFLVVKHLGIDRVVCIF